MREAGPSMIKAAGSGHTSTSSSSRVCSDRMPSLARSAVHALALLVHPMGSQWEPIRAMPFREATSENMRSRNVIAITSTSGLAGHVKAAAELGASVWRETSTHLLKTSRSGGGGRAGNGGAMSGTVRGEEKSGGSGEAYVMGKAVATSALSVLCSILCEEDAHSESLAAAKTNFSQDIVAPSSEESLRDSAMCPPREDAAAVRLAALRVLLHTCRSSSAVAHAFTAFCGGAAVQALLARLCLPMKNPTNGGGEVWHGAALHGVSVLSEISNARSGCHL